MTDKQINKHLRRQFSPIGWSLAGYYVLINVLVMVGMIGEVARQMLAAPDLNQYRDQMDLDAIAGNAWGYVAAVMVSLVILYAMKGPGFRREMLQKEKTMTPGVFFSVLCLCVGSQMVNSLWISGLELIFDQFDKSLMPLLESVSGDSNTFSMFLYASILAPIAEEILFRGYALRTLRPYGKRFAVLGSAFLFGIFHGNLLQTPYAVLMGLLLGYVALEYSLVWAILLHMFNNLVLADLLTRITASWPEPAYGMLNLILFGGSALLSVILLVSSRRKIREYRTGEWMDRRCVKCFLTNAGILALAMLMCVNMVLVFCA